MGCGLCCSRFLLRLLLFLISTVGGLGGSLVAEPDGLHDGQMTRRSWHQSPQKRIDGGFRRECGGRGLYVWCKGKQIGPSDRMHCLPDCLRNEGYILKEPHALGSLKPTAAAQLRECLQGTSL